MSPRAERATDRRPLLAVALVLVAAHVVLYPRLASLDAFYHIGHAAHYLDVGPFDTAFPWATQSVIRAAGADLWWGFHVVLMPFALLPDPAVAVSVAAFALSAIWAATLYGVLQRNGVAGAGWWTALGLVAVPNVLYRWVMLRPHVLSMAAAVVLVEALSRNRYERAAFMAGVLTWLHLGLFWMPLGIVVAWSIARRIVPAPETPGSILRGGGAVVLGGVVGWLLRPHPFATATLAKIQIVELFAAKGNAQPLTFAGELVPIGAGELIRTSPLFLVLWLTSIALWLRSIRTRRNTTTGTMATTALLCSAAFLVVTLVSARRAQVEWVGFGMVAVPLILAPCVGSAWTRDSLRRWGAVAATVLAVHLSWTAYRHSLNVRLVAFPPDLLSGAAAWLRDRTDAGDIVFHARWDNFGPLFARNRHNRYLSGMDPIFFYRQDPARYWVFFFVSMDATTEYSCDAFPCSDGTATDTHTVVRDHFEARWVVVEPQRNPKLHAYLAGAPGFRLAVDTGREVVYEVLP